MSCKYTQTQLWDDFWGTHLQSMALCKTMAGAPGLSWHGPGHTITASGAERVLAVMQLLRTNSSSCSALLPSNS